MRRISFKKMFMPTAIFASISLICISVDQGVDSAQSTKTRLIVILGTVMLLDHANI